MDMSQQSKSWLYYMLLHGFYVALGIAAILVLDYWGIGCPFKALTGYPCPTCGMTRSFLALIHCNIKESLSYNPMTLPVLTALLLGFHKKMFKNKRIIDIVIVTIVGINFVFYIYRLFK